SEAEYFRLVAPDPEPDRCFQPLRVRPLDASTTAEVLRLHARELAESDDVVVEDDLVRATVEAAETHLPNRALPDAAIELSVRLAMREFHESDTLPRIVAAPPGYVGYDARLPFLHEVARQPLSVVLLDEIEKAHPAVHRLFLQVFEEGFLTTATGVRAYFSDT